MATLQEIQTQVQQAESNIQTQRTQAQQAQTQAQEQLRQLETAQQKLPSNTSQRALRQTMGGIAGQVKRKAIERVKQAISGQKGKIGEQTKSIEEYKQQLTKYELEQIAPVKEQVRQAQEYNAAVDTINKAASQGMVGAYAIYGEGLVKQLAQKYIKQQSIAREGLKSEIKAFELANPTEKVNVDWKNLKVTGIQSGSLGETLSIKEYNNSIKGLEPTITSQEIKATNLPGVQSNVLLASDNQSLSMNTSSIRNDTNVSSGLSNRIPTSFLSKLGAGITGFVGLSSDIQIGKEAGNQKGTEIFQPLTQTVAGQTYPSGQGSLTTLRSFTPAETARFDSLNRYDITSNIPKLQADIKRLGQFENKQVGLTTQYNKLIENKLDAQGYFTGTNEEYNKVNNLYSQIESNQRRIESIKPTRTSSFFGYEREVPISRYGSPFGSFNAQTGTIIKAGGEAASYLGKNEGYFKTQAYNQTVYEPQFGTIQMNALTGKEITGYKDIVIPEKQFGTPEQFRKGGEVVTGLGMYATPFLGQAMLISGAGETLSRYDYSPKKFIKESTVGEKLSIGLDLALLGGFGALKGVRTIKNQAIRKAISTELRNLEGVELQSITRIYEKEGKVYADAVKKAGNVEQRVTYEGVIEETSTGKKFVSLGTSEIVTAGVIQPKFLGFNLGERTFTLGETSIAGGKGGMFSRGNIGKIELYDPLSATGIIPKEDFFGVVKIGGKTKEEIAKELRNTIRKVTSKDIPTKELQIPAGEDRGYFYKITDKFGLKTSPQEVGVVFKIPKPVENIGFKGKGQQSSQEFFDSLYSETKTVTETIPKIEEPLSLINLGKIAEESTARLSSLKLPIGKEISGLPVGGSIYAGTGTYETVTTTSISPQFLTVTPQKSLQGESLNFSQGNLFRVSPLGFQTEKQREGMKSIQRIDSSLTQRPSTRTFQSPRGITDLRVEQGTKPGQVTKQVTTESINIINPTINPPKPVPPKPEPPKPKPRFDLGETPNVKRRKGISRKKRPEEFLAITKRKGKEVVVGIGRTSKEAEFMAKKDVLGRLSATVKVTTRSGRQVQLIGDRTFKQSKTDPLALIQRKSARLGSLGERRAIKEARRFSLK